VYGHAKVGIVDDPRLTLGSANLNAHSFFSDSEAHVVTCDAALAPTPTATVGHPSRTRR
jgi:phosphatidylserine/phosphatidylglycerophosphate/cardiolipin synthase-like enzyme